MNDDLLSLGVVGGMGPAATNLFLKKITKLYQAKNKARENRDFPRIIMVTIPNADHMKKKSDINLVQILNQAIEICKFAKVDFIVSPCNTIHNYFSRLNPDIPILSIISALDVLYGHKLQNKKVLFLSTRLTKKSNIYMEFTKKNNIKFLYLDTIDQNKLDEIILEINGGVKNKIIKQKYLKMIAAKYKVNSILLACTELSQLYFNSVNLQIIDSLEALSEATYLVSSQIMEIGSFH